MTDKQKILNWFKSHRYLNCLSAIHEIQVYNLRSRACEMPELQTDYVKVTKKDGVKVRIARYSLVGG